MAFKPKQTTGKAKELIPAATHEAYCYGVVDLGTQPRKPYMGKPKDPAPMIVIFFEFPELTKQFKEDGPEEPMVKSQKYNFFTDEKSNLAKMLKGWVGDINSIDFATLPGTPASIKITHDVSDSDGKTYDNMAGISEMPAKLVPLMKPQHNESFVFSIDDDGFDSPKFDKLYQWVKDLLAESAEYKLWISEPNKSPLTKGDETASPDDSPFK